MNVLFCAYRDWAIEIVLDVTKKFKEHSFNLISNKDELETTLKTIDYDLIFFIGWSWMVENQITEKFFCICLHPSPLPKYRGGSPIQNQVINGETVGAVTLFKMDNLVDHGPIIFQKDISLTETLPKIFSEICRVGAIGIVDIITKYPNISLIPQDESEATYFDRRKPTMSEITISDIQNLTSLELYNKVRCLQHPYPLPYVICADGKKLFLLETKIDD